MWDLPIIGQEIFVKDRYGRLIKTRIEARVHSKPGQNKYIVEITGQKQAITADQIVVPDGDVPNEDAK